MWYITTLIITISSFYYLFYYKKVSIRVNKNDKKISKENIKILNLALASKIGVGSISGVALSILIGGKGTLFWIWISSIFLSRITFLETKAGIIFQGGPQVYIKDKLNNDKLSTIYSILIVITYLFAFILIQSNTILKAFSYTFNISELLITIILILCTYLSIKKGIDNISKIVSIILPIMSFIYITIGTIIFINNINLIPTILKEIVEDAFKMKSVITLPLIIGFQRSIFSNESGMGTTSMVVALSKSNDYLNESKTQIFGMYFITLVICSISALIILTTKYNVINNNINGIEIINYAFNYHFGNLGSIISTTIITLFAFSTIITSYYYGSLCLKNKNTISKIIVIIVISISTLITPNIIWNVVDIFCALLTLINLYALYKLRSKL